MNRLSLTLLTCLATGLLGCSKAPDPPPASGSPSAETAGPAKEQTSNEKPAGQATSAPSSTETPAPKKELTTKEKLIGRWKGTDTPTNPKPGDISDRLRLEFQKDGQLQINVDGHKEEPVTYEADGNKLTLTQTAPDKQKQSVVFSIEKLTDTEFVCKTPFGRVWTLTKDTTPPPPPLAKQTDADFRDSFPPKEVYATPQEVFTAAFAGQLKGDHETYVRCLSPRLQYRMAHELALKGLDKSIGQSRKKGKDAEFWQKHDQPIYDAMAKHGLTAEVLKATKYGDTDDRAERTGRALLSHVKDIGAFLVDYLTADDKAAGRRYMGKKEDLPKLGEVKIDGDKAKGEFVYSLDERERKQPIEFLKVGGGWRLLPRPESCSIMP